MRRSHCPKSGADPWTSLWSCRGRRVTHCRWSRSSAGFHIWPRTCANSRPVALGLRALSYPFARSVGGSAAWCSPAHVINQAQLAEELATFLVALRQVPAADGPPAGPVTAYRGTPLTHYAEESCRLAPTDRSRSPAPVGAGCHVPIDPGHHLVRIEPEERGCRPVNGSAFTGDGLDVLLAVTLADGPPL
jgi:hypothetical protein